MSTYDESLSNAALKLLEYDSPSDDDLYEQAQYKAEQSYQDDYDQLFNTTVSKKNILLRAIQDAETDYAKSIDEMNSYFKDSSEKLSDEALTRGLGRSTYALDIQSENESDRQQTLQSLLAEKVDAVNTIQDNIDSLEQEFLENQNYLTNQKTEDIENLLSALKTERDETLREINEYNNELILDYKDYQLDQLEADRDYQIALKKLNKKTYSSGSSDSASNTLMDEWNSLTDAGKLKFYSENTDALKSLDLDTYKNIVREIMALKQMGVVAATTKAYNYYQ